MKPLLLFGFVILLWTIGTTSGRAATSAKQVFIENRMAVVHVEVAADPASPNRTPSGGTGFIISGSGYVLTAKHVLNGYVNQSTTPISVRIGSLDGPVSPADPLSFDIGIDVQMLKLRSPIGLGLSAYRVVPRGDSSPKQTGDDVFVVGFNLTSNIAIETAHIATTLGGGVCGNLCWEVTAPGTVFGMSGAPVFDSDGRVVGIVEGGQPGSGTIYVYPEELLQPFASIAEWKRAEVQAPDTATVSSGNTIVMDGNVNYAQSGFSFARNQVVAWNSPDGDILVATADRSGTGLAEFFLPYDTPPYAAPQDAAARSGISLLNAATLDSVHTCPLTNYQFHWVPAKLGGVYCVRTRSGTANVKIQVQGVYSDRIAFDWERVE
jgi:S1-C subfamily serine protease